MIFTSFEFVLFLAAVILVRVFLRNLGAEKWFLLVSSCVFYMSWNAPFVVLILFTALLDYWIARKLGRVAGPGPRQRWLVTSLVINLGLLGFFKYGNFFLENICLVFGVLGWQVGPWHYDTSLPPAISFYTFASMSYVLDVYYERIPASESPRDYTLFLTFFPKLLSGPIVRASELLPQLKERVRAGAEDIEVGLGMFMIGAVKKLVIADQISGNVNLIFSSPTRYDGPTLLQGLLGYAVQLYCDFSGYSDMAIGCARILGFRFPENFQMPFSATSITEFWRRWHITLSKWFRDYAFLPLELATRSNPHPNVRVSVNIMIMMLLVGLWHGPSWNFVIFGGIHGLGLVLHKLWTVWNPLASARKRAAVDFGWTICARSLTLGVVLLAFVFFRTESVGDSGRYLRGLMSWNQGTRMWSPFILMALAGVGLVHLLLHKDRNLAEEIPKRGLAVRIAFYSCLVLLLVCLGATDASPFIYFKF